MDSKTLIDAQFDRAVEIVQSLPKTGPIQTGYEEKLTMYSLYKQATVGNVQSPRPSVWDMLGRAKWDAWAKHKDLDSYEAKWLYVEALLKVLRRYSDKTVAMDLVRELESYTGDPSNMVMSGSISRSAGSSSSGSTASDDDAPAAFQLGTLPLHLRGTPSGPSMPGQLPDPRLDESSSDDDDEADDAVPPVPSVYAPSHSARPQSSLSSRRYRTPVAGSAVLSPPPVPAMQPLPGYHTESAFAEHAHTPAVYPGQYQDRYARSSATDLPSSLTSYPVYRAPSQQAQRRPYAAYAGVPQRPASRPTLERVLENMQATLAALTERIETLEELAHRSNPSLSAPGRVSPRWTVSSSAARPRYDLDDMGMWSVVMRPMARVINLLRYVLSFLAHGSQSRSPAVVVVRRLFLDISFMLCMLAVTRIAWRRSGMRRREVMFALGGLWRAVAGERPPRRLVDRGV